MSSVGSKSNLRKKRRLAGNNAGLSLVELIITIAIMAIIGTAISQFILVGLNSYRRANDEVSVQQEAQMAMNQMSDTIIDVTSSINCRIYTAGGSFWLGPSSSIFDEGNIGIDGDDLDKSGVDNEYKDNYDSALGKMLILYNGDYDPNPKVQDDPFAIPTPKPSMIPKSDNNQNFSYVIYWDNEGTIAPRKKPQSLYLAKVDKSVSTYPVADAEYELLAENVSNFNIDLSQLKSKGVVKLTMEVFFGDRTYTTTNNIKVRNRVSINTINFDEDKEIQTYGTLEVKERYILEPNDTFTLPSASLTGRNMNAVGCKWTLVSGGEKVVGHNNGEILTTGEIASIKIEQTARHDGTTSGDHDIELSVETNATKSDDPHSTDYGVPLDKKTVYIDIKRVEAVNVYRIDNDDRVIGNEIPLRLGEVFYVQAKASGSFLGEPCDGDGCKNDNPAQDFDIDIFNVHNPRSDADTYGTKWGLLKNVSGDFYETANESVECNFGLAGFPDYNKFPISVSTDKSKNLFGKKFHFQTRSSLAEIKGYGPVTGHLIIGIAARPSITFDSDIEYGHNSIAQCPPLYLSNGSSFSDHKYFIALRISESPSETRDLSQDLVYLYYSEGNSISINPDILGLDWRKQYYLSVQVIGDVEGRWIPDYDSRFADEKNRLIARYNSPGALASDGGLISNEEFVTSAVSTYILFPPKLTFHRNGYNEYYWSTYAIDDVDIGTSSDKEVKFYSYPHTEGLKPNSGEVKSIYFKIYKRNLNEANDGEGEWTLVADSVENMTTNEVVKLDGLTFSNYAGDYPYYKYEKNKVKTGSLIGEYRCVPWICYKHLQPADHMLVKHLIWKNYEPDYTTTFKKEYPDVAMTFGVYGATYSNVLVKTGKSSGDNTGKFEMRSFYITLPSEEENFKKLFNLRDTNIQTLDGGFTFTARPSGEKYKFDYVTLQYFAKEKTYELKLGYDYTDNNGVTKKVECGTYVWNEDEDSRFWKKVEAGNCDKYYYEYINKYSISYAKFNWANIK